MMYLDLTWGRWTIVHDTPECGAHILNTDTGQCWDLEEVLNGATRKATR